MRQLPVVEHGKLKPEATFIALGYMFHPEEARSAFQLAQLYQQETEAALHDESVSEHATSVFERLRPDQLRLVGEMTLLVARNLKEYGETSIGKAAFTVFQNHSTDRMPNGKRRAVSESVIRRQFGEYSAALHLWAAFEIQMQTEGCRDVRDFLSLAHLVHNTLVDGNFKFKSEPWAIPAFEGAIDYAWPTEGLVENPDQIATLLKDYKSRSGAK